jgi:hypothetical protein
MVFNLEHDLCPGRHAKGVCCELSCGLVVAVQSAYGPGPGEKLSVGQGRATALP